MQVVWPEMAALGDIVLVVRGRKGRDRHGILGRPDINHPGVLHRLFVDVAHRLVGHNAEAPVEQGEGAVSAPGERRRPVGVGNEPRGGLVGNVEKREPAVPPGRIGGVAGDHGVVQGHAPGKRHRLAASFPHARQSPTADLARARRVLHVDDHQDVIGVAVEQRGRVGVPLARPPDAVQSQALDLHEADGAWMGRVLDIVDAHASRKVLAALAELAGVHALNRGAVIVRLLHVDGIEVELLDHEQQVVGGLNVDRPGALVSRQEVDRPWIAWIAHVDDADTAAENVADESMASMHHALNAVGAAGLVGSTNEFDVLDGVENLGHGVAPDWSRG